MVNISESEEELFQKGVEIYDELEVSPKDLMMLLALHGFSHLDFIETPKKSELLYVTVAAWSLIMQGPKNTHKEVSFEMGDKVSIKFINSLSSQKLYDVVYTDENNVHYIARSISEHILKNHIVLAK